MVVGNNTGHDLDLRLSASCGCTELKPEELTVQEGKAFELNPAIRFPNENKTFEVAIFCKDELRGKNFKIVVRGESLHKFDTIPGTLKVHSEKKQAFKVRLVENFTDAKIVDVRLVSDKSFELIESSGLDLTIRAENPRPDQISDTLVFQLKTSNGIDEFVRVSVEYLAAPLETCIITD